jgi:hypothetical protein
VWSSARLAESIRLVAGSYDLLLDSYLSRTEAWHRAPGAPSVPTDFTIEDLFVPEDEVGEPQPPPASFPIPNS